MFVNFSKRSLPAFGALLILLPLTGCAPQGLYYWGDYESSLYERYVENGNQQTDAYLRNTFTEAANYQRKVPPGVHADYGFVLFTRGDKAGAISYFQKERELYPESQALMNKLIERIEQKDKAANTSVETTSPATVGGAQ
ncbi:MAG: DUF4810 domain-containing protein [Gammaproteobacteria bacterium]